MTAALSTSLYCDQRTRPTVDGMEVRCCLQFGPTDLSVERTRYLAREYGWKHTGIGDYCPQHAARRGASAADIVSP